MCIPVRLPGRWRRLKKSLIMIQPSQSFFFLCLIILFPWACESSPTPQEGKIPPPECRAGERRCRDGNILELCGEGRWASYESCRFYQACDVQGGSPDAPVCRDLPLESGSPKEFMGGDTTVDKALEILAPGMNSAPCRMFRALALETAETTKPPGASRKRGVREGMRVGLSEYDRLLVMRCALAYALGELKRIAVSAPHMPQFGGAETRIKEKDAETAYFLRYETGKKVGAAKFDKPETSLEFDLSDSPILNAPEGRNYGVIRNDDLSAYASLNYRSRNISPGNRIEGRLRKLIGRLRFGLGGFYRKKNFRDPDFLCADAATLEAIGDAFPELSRTAGFYACTGDCREDMVKALPQLRRIARSGETPGVKPVELSTEARALFRRMTSGLACLALAERLTAIGKLPIPLAPAYRLGIERTFALMNAVMPPGEYADRVFALASADKADDRRFRSGLALAGRTELRGLVMPRLESGLDRPTRMALPHWVRKDSPKAIPLLVKFYPRYARDPDIRRELLNIMAENASSALLPFFYERLGDRTATPPVIRYLLLNPESGSKTRAWAALNLGTADRKTIRLIFDHLRELLHQDAAEAPGELIEAIRGLRGRTTDFIVYREAHDVLKRFEDRGWEWPDRSTAIDRYVHARYSGAKGAEWLASALDGLGAAGEDDVIGLYYYALGLESGQRERLREVLVLASEGAETVRPVSERVKGCILTGSVSRMAAEVLERLDAGASKDAIKP